MAVYPASWICPFHILPPMGAIRLLSLGLLHMGNGRGNAPFISPLTAAFFYTESGIQTSRQVAPGNGCGEPCGAGGGGGDGLQCSGTPVSRGVG